MMQESERPTNQLAKRFNDSLPTDCTEQTIHSKEAQFAV